VLGGSPGDSVMTGELVDSVRGTIHAPAGSWMPSAAQTLNPLSIHVSGAHERFLIGALVHWNAPTRKLVSGRGAFREQATRLATHQARRVPEVHRPGRLKRCLHRARR